MVLTFSLKEDARTYTLVLMFSQFKTEVSGLRTRVSSLMMPAKWFLTWLRVVEVSVVKISTTVTRCLEEQTSTCWFTKVERASHNVFCFTTTPPCLVSTYSRKPQLEFITSELLLWRVSKTL